MTEDFTSLAVAYLCHELDPAARSAFEAQLEQDAVAVAELKAVADALGMFASAAAPAPRLAAEARADMFDAILRSQSGAPSAPRTRFRAWAWPLAASVLAAANIGQWGYHRWAEAAAAAAADAHPVVARQPDVSGDFLPGATEFPTSARHGLQRVATRGSTTGAPPSLRQTITFTLSQTMVTTTRALPRSPNDAAQQGALELHNLPRLAADQMLVLWARRADAGAYEPVGEIPRAIYGGSGTINYQLRPGTKPAVHFIVTVEHQGPVADVPSQTVVCSGP